VYPMGKVSRARQGAEYKKSMRGRRMLFCLPWLRA
jgi:hypothetical protein